MRYYILVKNICNRDEYFDNCMSFNSLKNATDYIEFHLLPKRNKCEEYAVITEKVDEDKSERIDYYKYVCSKWFKP